MAKLALEGNSSNKALKMQRIPADRCLKPRTWDKAHCSQCGNATWGGAESQCRSCIKRSEADLQAEAEAKQADWRTLSSAPVQDVPWSDASEMMWCHGGSGGVFLLRLPTGAVCLKTESCSLEMLFAQKLAEALSVRTARMRAVANSHPERAAICSALEQAVPTFDDHRLQVPRARGAEALIVMEFIDGCAMMGVAANGYLQQHRDTSRVWHVLGRLMGFDVLINNFDRLPLAWSNEGNLGNVMLSTVLDGPVGIDHSVHPITNPAGLQNYLGRVRRVCVEVRDGDGASCNAVKQAIYNNTAIALSSKELEELRYGCLELLQEVSRLASTGDMERILDEVSDNIRQELGCAQGKSCHSLIHTVSQCVHEALAEGL